jgi:hypothetical protein
MNVYSSLIGNNHAVETIQMHIKGWMANTFPYKSLFHYQGNEALIDAINLINLKTLR